MGLTFLFCFYFNLEESPAAFNFNNTRQFLTGLNSIKEQNGGDTFRGISHAAELVPYDSAVFISTAKLAEHTDQVQDSAITLLKKRIRVCKKTNLHMTEKRNL